MGGGRPVEGGVENFYFFFAAPRQTPLQPGGFAPGPPRTPWVTSPLRVTSPLMVPSPLKVASPQGVPPGGPDRIIGHDPGSNEHDLGSPVPKMATRTSRNGSGHRFLQLFKKINFFQCFFEFFWRSSPGPPVPPRPPGTPPGPPEHRFCKISKIFKIFKFSKFSEFFKNEKAS